MDTFFSLGEIKTSFIIFSIKCKAVTYVKIVPVSTLHRTDIECMETLFIEKRIHE